MIQINKNETISSLPYSDIINELNLNGNVHAKQKLSNLLVRTSVGTSDILVSPLGRSGPEKLLNEWTKIFESCKDGKVNSVLNDLELSQKDKFSPRSIAKPWSERKEDTLDYFTDNNIDYSGLSCQGITSDKGILRPLSLENASKYIKKSTSAGLPSMRKKGEVLAETIENLEHFLDRSDPAVLFTRTQEGGKTRSVFGIPLADVLYEMRFYRPILDYQKQLKWRSALLGPDAVAKHLSEIIDVAISKGLTLISMDFSNYDRSIKQGLQFKVGEYYTNLYQSKYSDDINKIIQRKSTIGLVTPSGTLRGPHGEPSGSAFTNEDDSIAQYCIAHASGTILEGLYDIQGDDGVYAIDPEKVSSFFNIFSKYGLAVNESKSYQSPNYLIYLQNLFHPDYRKNGEICGIYPTYRALNRIIYQERWSNFEDYDIDGKDYYAIRTLSILENCKNHPLFEKFVKFILSKDKYSLKVTSAGISEYVKFISETEGAEGQLINQFGDNIRGIRGWESFKLVRSLVDA